MRGEERINKPTGAGRSLRFAASKFAIPKSGFQPVYRTRLIERLDRGEKTRLTLVVGSAGAGKTILLGDWLTTHPDWSSAWLNCDAEDSDPLRFLSAVIESLRRASGEAGLGEDARQLLLLDGEVSADVIASLADDVERLGIPRVMIIDDFHLTGPGGVDVLSWLLEYRPAGLQVVLASRVDPPLRLHRMRVHEELIEVRERDLSFSAEETGRLMSSFGVHLSESDVSVVQERSEGWAAGLQMAAISIRKRIRPGGVADRVDLRSHTVAGYFLDEVLYRQPEPVVQFMLASSVLDELSAPICTAVCGSGAPEHLERVYRDHLFLNMVDEAAGTYRYHQLIKEVLQAELHATDPEAQGRLHRRAAQYLLDIGRVGAAARHLLAAGDAAGASHLLNHGLIGDYGTNPADRSALDDIEPNDFANIPAILVPLAAELLLRGDFGHGSQAFELAVKAGAGGVPEADLAFRFAAVCTMHHHFRGEETQALAHRDRALQVATQATGSEDWLVHLDAMGAYCHLHLGHFDEALRLAEVVVSSNATLPAARAMFYPGIRSQVAWMQGVLYEAEVWADRALASADRFGFDRLAFIALRTKALLALESRDLTRAAELTEGRLDAGRPFLDFLAQIDRARIWAAAGDLFEALASLPAARAALRSDDSILLVQADELEARIRTALGDTGGAATIAARLPDDRRPVILAMIQLKAGRPEEAQAALNAFSARRGSVRAHLELELLHAEVAVVQHSREALRLVQDVLDVAEGNGFIQTVLDTAPNLVEYLTADSERYARSDHLEALIAAASGAREQAAIRAQSGSLAEPLTEAEIKVLRKLPERLTYADVASDLHLSLNTVKTHLRHSYMKLGVSSRSAAIERAASLGLM